MKVYILYGRQDPLWERKIHYGKIRSTYFVVGSSGKYLLHFSFASLASFGDVLDLLGLHIVAFGLLGLFFMLFIFDLFFIILCSILLCKVLFLSDFEMDTNRYIAVTSHDLLNHYINLGIHRFWDSMRLCKKDTFLFG